MILQVAFLFCQAYHKSGNFRVLIFLCKNIFVIYDIHENFFSDSTFPGLVIWNEAMHAKKTPVEYEQLAAFVAG